MADKLQRGDLATVFGGTGFVGRYAVRALAKRGVRIRAAVRRPDLAGHLQPMGAVGQIHAVQANLRYSDSVQAATIGADYVVNLVAVLASTGKQTFDALHVDGARSVARAAREAGVRKFVHVSALGADPGATSQYAQSKGMGEQAVLEEFPDAIILRPSIVFGPEDQFFNRFAKLAQSTPFLPLIGGGRTRFQPIYVMDLADAIVASLSGMANPGATYEIGGPEILSLRDVLDRVQGWSGRHRPYVSVPFALAKLMAVLTWPLPNAARPLTLDQVRLLQADNIVASTAIAERRTLTDLGNAPPQSTGNIVPVYLERFRPRGQYSHYRG
ncbi:MAG: complex I NDUFA9 subunit family protein [Hyphomicrobiaceae bacterium]